MSVTPRPPIGRRLLAEFLGSALLVAVVVGSGIAAQQLSPNDVGLQLLENSTATFLGLTVLILLFGPVSGAHFNPVVSLADWFLGRRTGHGLPLGEVAGYAVAQVVGAVAGAVLANVMFDVGTTISTKDRSSGGHLLAEVVATTFLVALIFALTRTGRGAIAAPAVGAYIGAAYWFTSSTSFANPAVTVGRIFSDTFAGIAPGSAGPFVLAQLIGLVVGAALILALYPDVSERADDVVLPWQGQQRAPAGAPDADGEPRSPDEPVPSSTPDQESATNATPAPVRRPQPMSTDQNTTDRPSVLYVCVHNAGRSQMAAAYTRELSGGAVEVRSAGSEPADQVNPAVREALLEEGIDIAAERPKILTTHAVQASDVVITMGCGDACPIFPGKRYEDWTLEDPAGQGVDAVRPIRDEIKRRVLELLASLDVTPIQPVTRDVQRRSVTSSRGWRGLLARP